MEDLGLVEENAAGNPNAARLIPDFGRINPDDILGKVQYEKGYAFLNYLETLLTPPVFQKFLQGHIKKYRDRNLQSRDFVQDFADFVFQNFSQEEA
jgi:leukotriene-A4 hydrolase